MLLDCTRCLVHSLAVVEAMCVLLVAVGIVAVLDVVIAIVATTSVAVVMLTRLLNVVDVKAAPVLEGVDVEVEVLPVAY